MIGFEIGLVLIFEKEYSRFDNCGRPLQPLFKKCLSHVLEKMNRKEKIK